jgi:hypothetical protein
LAGTAASIMRGGGSCSACICATKLFRVWPAKRGFWRRSTPIRLSAPAVVVVAPQDDRVVGQAEQAPRHAVPQLPGAAALEVGAPATADQQRVAGEEAHRGAAAPQEAGAARGVPRRGDRLEAFLAEGHRVAVEQRPVVAVGQAVRADRRRRAGRGLQRCRPRDVVGMDMGVDDGDEPQAVRGQQREVALELRQHRIDHHRLAAGVIAQQVGPGGGLGVEELQEHGVSPVPRRGGVPGGDWTRPAAIGDIRPRPGVGMHPGQGLVTIGRRPTRCEPASLHRVT